MSRTLPTPCLGRAREGPLGALVFRKVRASARRCPSLSRFADTCTSRGKLRAGRADLLAGNSRNAPRRLVVARSREGCARVLKPPRRTQAWRRPLEPIRCRRSLPDDSTSRALGRRFPSRCRLPRHLGRSGRRREGADGERPTRRRRNPECSDSSPTRSYAASAARQRSRLETRGDGIGPRNGCRSSAACGLLRVDSTPGVEVQAGRQLEFV
jgi:hypothetical protein